MRRIRLLVLAVGLFLALALSACEPPRPCAESVTTFIYSPMRVGRTTIIHAVPITTCVRYAA